MTPPSSAKDQGQQIAEAVMSLPETAERRLIAVAGPPGAGKTTITQCARETLEQRGVATGILPMDGFHLDNDILDARGLRRRKGAPETFDLAGFRHMLERVLVEAEVAIPTFDRGLDKAIAASAIITADQRTVLVEGNYLLLDSDGWADLRVFWTMTVFLDVSADILEERLMQRWLDQGFDDDLAQQKTRLNDLPNAQRVQRETTRYDLALS